MRSCQYKRTAHAFIDRIDRKSIKRQLPENMPRPLRRQLAKSIARLERLAQEGVDVPGIAVDYNDLEGGISTFHYIPGNQADLMAEELLEAVAILTAGRGGAQA